MTFSMSLLRVLRTIGWKDLGELYDILFGFRIIIEIDTLKCNGQCPRLKQALVILIMKVKYELLLIILLRTFQEILSSSEADKPLYLLIAALNSSFKKEPQSKVGLKLISFRMSILTWWLWAELNNWCRACQSSSSSIQGQPLNCNTSMAGSFCLQT